MRRVIVLAAFLAAGCSVSAHPYAVHPDTITALRAHTGKTVTMTDFTSDKPGKSEILCRAANMIQTPGGVPFERYVGDAFKTELLVAGIAAPTAPVTLGGHLERMHFTTAGEAEWELRVTLTSSNGRRLTIAEDYAFNWHFDGISACREASTAMALAVQALVRKAVKHPEFAALLTPGLGPAASPTPAEPSATTTPPAPTTAAAAVAPTAPPRPPEDLREWARGKWRSTGGSTSLVIDRNLRWSWDSTYGGRYSGSGTGDVQDGALLLRGWHSRSYPMTLHLRREGDTLVGEIRTSQNYPVVFIRE